MSLEKCQKYLYKLSNANINDRNFGIYLTKLNFWYNQLGGNNPIILTHNKMDPCGFNDIHNCTTKCQIDLSNNYYPCIVSPPYRSIKINNQTCIADTDHKNQVGITCQENGSPK